MSALFLYNFLFMSALFNQKNPLYYFCKKSNEHCPFISPKAHVFALHPQSGEGQKCAPPKGSLQKGAEGRPPLLLWELSFVFPQDVEARRTDFTRRPRSTFSPIKFLLDLKINTCTMIWYDMIFPIQEPPWENELFTNLMFFFSKNSPLCPCKGSNDWSMTILRYFAPAEVQASTPS